MQEAGSHCVAGLVGIAARLARPLGFVPHAQGQAKRPRGLATVCCALIPTRLACDAWRSL